MLRFLAGCWHEHPPRYRIPPGPLLLQEWVDIFKRNSESMGELEMSYDEGMEFLACAPYDTSESDAEQAAHHQRNLDVLWLVGNQYDVRIDHMKLLCDVSGISFEEFCKYSGKPATC